ncbi:plasma membrane localization protein [Monascus purpureus]|uniref:Plasma membrane localization protein n=1 Tax=Monascus purpureus TaxID=5098 RepID=A0A507QXZ2_MONPU|nr:plasma membrane localization protein [Monascus purpureus]BDD61015.1 hypothetical protein MAP00_006098 [Monascus purpureus]
MDTMRQSCRPKHQVLILKCYPKYQKGVQEVKPNSSELSYLLYYASTRRSKLTKVGAFLEKRAARDVWRRRLGNVQVTLQILSALIEKVPRDLPIYARSVLTVIESVLRSNEISIVEDSISTFETFCRYQDTASLAAEGDFATHYREVVQLYAEFADPNPSVQARAPLSPQVAIRWRNAGLRAIMGVVGPGGLSDGEDLLRIVLPVILKNLYTGEDDILVSLQLQLQSLENKEFDEVQQLRKSSTSSPPAEKPDGDPALASQTAADADRKADMEARLLALRCLERIVVSGSTRGQIRAVTTIVLQFITSKSPLPDGDRGLAPELNSRGNWATSLIELVAKWCPVQIRFVIGVTAMEELLNTDPADLERSSTLACMVDWLLKSPVNMIGLSVMDVLLGLLQFTLRQLKPQQSMNGHVSEKYRSPGAAQSQLLALLEQCIGSLATHIYYGDQVADMIRAILVRVQNPGSPESPPTSTPDAQPGSLETGSNSATIIQKESRFNFPSARVTALKAVKNILVVANLRRFVVAGGVESRKRVGVYVWEGTQWLLHVSDQDVRYAYVDAFLTWLNLETKNDTRLLKTDMEKHPKLLRKREMSDIMETPGTRAVPANPEKAQANCLRLFHLTIYEVALESPTKASEFALLHLVLVGLIEHLGVNAIRFGLPMILRLQDDMASVGTLAAIVNIGSLVYGYLLALCERFELNHSRIGMEINNEIEKRKRKGVWLEEIHLPPLSLDKIVPGVETQINGSAPGNANTLTPFRSADELVRQMEQAYVSGTRGSQSPSGSSRRDSTAPILSRAVTGNETRGFPAAIKEQMLSSWSKEACMAAIESDSTTTKSGSRNETLTIRNRAQENGAMNGSISSRMSSHRSVPGVYVSDTANGRRNSRRMSLPNDSGSLTYSSSRDSPVRFDELRRALAVNRDSKPRRLSPLRGRLDPSTKSIISSSSESMVSGAYSLSELGETQSLEDGETPKASAIRLPSNGTQADQFTNDIDSEDDIPPVPPIPASLTNIPGGYPSDTGLPQSYMGRPVTAPSPAHQRRPSRSSMKGKLSGLSTPRPTTLSKRRSLSSTKVTATDNEADVTSPPNGLQGEGEGTLEPRERDELQKLLNGFLSPRSNGTTNGDSAYLPVPQHLGFRGRGQGGGIGRPPY